MFVLDPNYVSCFHRRYPIIDLKCLFPAQNQPKGNGSEKHTDWSEAHRCLLFWLTLGNHTKAKTEEPKKAGTWGPRSCGSLWAVGNEQADGGQSTGHLRAGYLSVPYFISVSCPKKTTYSPCHPMHLIAHLIDIHVEHSRRDSKLTALFWVVSLWKALH